MKDKILRLEEFNQLKEIMKSIIDEGIKKVSENPENEQEIEDFNKKHSIMTYELRFLLKLGCSVDTN